MTKSLPHFGMLALLLAASLVAPDFPGNRVSAGEDKIVPSPAPKPADDTAASTDLMSGLDWSATKQSFLDDPVKGKIVVLSGSAFVRYQGTKLEADNIVFYQDSHEMYAEGHCRMRIGESEMQASAVYMDVDSDSGYLVDAEIKMTTAPDTFGKSVETTTFGINENKALHTDLKPNLHPPGASPGEVTVSKAKDPYGVYVDVISDPQARASFFLKADKFIRLGKLHFQAENAFMTNDEMVHPIYGLKAANMDFYLHEVPDPQNPGKTTLAGEKVIAEKGRIQIFGHDLFPFPTVTYDMANKREYFSVNQGKSGRWGNFILTRFGYDMGPAKHEMQSRPFQFTHVYVDVDERTKRGPALGMDVAWQTQGYTEHAAGTDMLFYNYGAGYVRGYGDDEIQIKTEDDIARAAHNLERRIQPKIDGFQRIQFDANLLFLARRKADNAGPPSFALQKHENDVRGLAEFQEHLPLKCLFGVKDVQLDFKYKRQSDRDFILEYFPVNYNRESESEALASARKATDDTSLEFLFRTRPEDFDSAPPRSPFDFGTFTGYEPALTYSTMPKDLGWGIYMSSEEQAARMKRYFERDIYNQSNLDSGRLYSKIDFARPTNFCFMNVTPYLGAQGMLYDNSRQNNLGNFVGRNGINGDAISQGAIKYGIDFDSRIYGTFCDLKNDALGIDGLRHVVEPRISFRGTSNTVTDPVKVFDFDGIDDLQRDIVITFSIDQTFQTRIPVKEGESRTISVAGFDTALDFYPSETDEDRLLNGESFGLLRFEGFLRVLDAVRLDAGAGINPQNFKDETAQYKITVDPHDRWRLQFAERFNYTDPRRAITGSDQYHLQVEYELSDRWGLSYEQVWENKRSLQLIKGRQIEYFGITRHFGPFDAGIVYSVDKNLNDSGYYGVFRPTIVSRNLILAENDPLVTTPTLGGEFEEPETRNYDPFQIIRQQHLNRKANKNGGSDVPAPPQATSMNNAKAEASGETVDLDKLPGRKPAPKKAAIDADEWTLPASVPTSARDR